MSTVVIVAMLLCRGKCRWKSPYKGDLIALFALCGDRTMLKEFIVPESIEMSLYRCYFLDSLMRGCL
jgi:hypothetical protein